MVRYPFARVLALGALLITLQPAGARASYRLDWRAGRVLQCTTTAAVVEAVEERLGRSVFDGEAENSVVVELDTQGSAWELHLSLVDSTGTPVAERRLKSVSGDLGL